jgi:hypothetical protein
MPKKRKIPSIVINANRYHGEACYLCVRWEDGCSKLKPSDELSRWCLTGEGYERRKDAENEN